MAYYRTQQLTPTAKATPKSDALAVGVIFTMCKPMINEHEILQLLIDVYPQSRDIFVERADEWVPEKSGQGSFLAHRLLGILSYAVVGDFVAGGYENAQELFGLIERFVADGDETVKNAACTNFIENLQNIASHENQFEDKHFVSLLGVKSKEYAKAWDEFTGVKTNGL